MLIGYVLELFEVVRVGRVMPSTQPISRWKDWEPPSDSYDREIEEYHNKNGDSENE